MEQDEIDLVRRLCSEAGSLMENVSPDALITPNDRAELRSITRRLAGSIERMAAMISAARAMLE